MLAHEDVDAFGLWAFGENFNDLDNTLDYMESWNDSHGAELSLKPTGHISEDAPKMVDLWRSNSPLVPSSNG